MTRTNHRDAGVPRRAALLGLGGALLAAPAVRAQGRFPDKPVRLLVPWAAGGTTDIQLRALGDQAARRLGQPIIVENKPGAGGVLAAQQLLQEKPDGYVVAQMPISVFRHPQMASRALFNPLEDFTYVIHLTGYLFGIVVKADAPWQTLGQFLDYAKANPGKVNYGSPGNGSGPHIAVELLKSLAGIDVVHVPYKGAGPALTGLLGGEVGMTVVAAAAGAPHVQSGKVKALAVLSNERAANLPGVPTSKEAGVDAWQVALWWGILAPAGTPKEIVGRLNAAWVKTAALPETIEKMKAAGFEPMSGTPEQLNAFINSETARWAKVIKDANIVMVE